MSINMLDELGSLIFHSKYARYDEKKKRRETWNEVCDRVLNMHLRKLSHLSVEYKQEIKAAFKLVRDKKLVPSMRSCQFGGLAIEANASRMHNCCAGYIYSIRSFAESFHLLLSGTGLGVGLFNKYLANLPNLITSSQKSQSVLTYTIEDSIEGWADSLEVLLMCYFVNTPFSGRKIIFDYSKIRPAGSPLKTGGGKAPGADGLRHAHKQIIALLEFLVDHRHEGRLNSVDAYDILMYVADATLSGGVRRSASIVIFEESDALMMNAKVNFKVSRIHKFYYDDDHKQFNGKIEVDGRAYMVSLSDAEYADLKSKREISWIKIHPQRARSNNTVQYIRKELTREKLAAAIERTKLYGEPGFMFVDKPYILGNPCLEVNFSPVADDGSLGFMFCNLTEINGAKIKTKSDFIKAAKAASLIGTLQATYTDFKYLGATTKRLTDEEALLGVSITGIFDNPKLFLNESALQEAAYNVISTNKRWAEILGINPAARTTVIKPSGTSSLVLSASSGIHPHHARKYFRRVQYNKNDVIYKYFKKHNPQMCEESVWSANKTDDVITFPVEVPKSVMIKSDIDAIKHLEIVRLVQKNWVLAGNTDRNFKRLHNNVSCSIQVKDNEWEKVIDYLYHHNKYFCGISLIPDTINAIYAQAPLEAVTDATEAKFNALTSQYKPINYTEIKEYADATELQKTIACAGGKCDLTI